MNRALEIKKELFWRDSYYNMALEMHEEGDIKGAIMFAKLGASYIDDLPLLKRMNFGDFQENVKVCVPEENALPNIYLETMAIQNYADN